MKGKRSCPKSILGKPMTTNHKQMSALLRNRSVIQDTYGNSLPYHRQLSYSHMKNYDNISNLVLTHY